MKNATNYLKRKLRFHRISIILLFLLAISCSKDKPLPIEHLTQLSKNPLKNQSSSLLTKTSSDLPTRLGSIRRDFYQRKLDLKFSSKVNKGITWKIEWAKPMIQTVNDSASYVFYRLRASVVRNGKQVIAEEVGAASYLMVKNETEFYKAFFYLPEDKRSKTPIDDTAEAIMKKFTGKLLLSSLEDKRGFLLDYKDGKISDEYKKSQVSSKKLTLKGASTSGWETQCHYEMTSCTWVTWTPDCGGEIQIAYTWNCEPPYFCQNAGWNLTDYSATQICEMVWVPNPPNPPDNPGDGGGGDDGIDRADPGNLIYQIINYQDGQSLQDRFDCFDNVPTNESTVYSITICTDIPVNGSPNELLDDNLDPGHTFIEITKKNGASSVTQTFGFYPQKNNIATLLVTVNSVVIDNVDAAYDASLVKMLNEVEFNNMLATAIAASSNSYNLANYNCSNYALDVFNSQSTPLNIGTYTGGASATNYGVTPNEVYKVIKNGHANQYPGASIAGGSGAVSSYCN